MKAVIFDLGQVLVGYDPQRTARAISMFSLYNEKVVDDLFEKHKGALQIGGIILRDLYHIYLKEAGFQGEFQRFRTAFDAGLSRLEEPLSYACSLLGVVKVGVISNTYDGHVDWLLDNVPELLSFDSVIFSNVIGYAKPGPEIFKIALAQLDVKPEDAIFVDDIEENVRGAERVGIKGIHHTTWKGTQFQLKKWI